MPAYRTTTSAFVCAPTNHFEDLTQLESVLKRYRELGGKVPPTVEAAMQAAASGQNLEASLNVACDGLMKFYMREENRCALEAGFKSVEDMERRRATEWSQVSEVFDPCIANVSRQWQLTNFNYTFNPFNEDSAVREFLRRTRDQVFAISSKYVKKKVLDKVKGKPPGYENPKP